MENFKTYVAQRIVQAIPLTKGEGVKAQIVLSCETSEEHKPGYLVRNDDGRTIWIEKEEFESKFKLMEGKQMSKPREKQKKESGLLLLSALLSIIGLIQINVITKSNMYNTLKGIVIAAIVCIVVEVFQWVMKHYNQNEGKK